MRVTINIREHSNKIRQMLHEMYGIPLDQIDDNQIRRYVQKDIKWWLNDSEDNENSMLEDGLHNFTQDEDDWVKKYPNSFEEDEYKTVFGKTVKTRTNYMIITQDRGKYPIRELGEQLLGVKGVYHVETTEWPPERVNVIENGEKVVKWQSHGEFRVYCTKPTKKSALMRVLSQYGYEQVYMYNDLYETGKRRFKFHLTVTM